MQRDSAEGRKQRLPGRPKRDSAKGKEARCEFGAHRKHVTDAGKKTSSVVAKTMTMFSGSEKLFLRHFFFPPSKMLGFCAVITGWLSPRGDIAGIRTPALLHLRASCDAENAQPAPLRLMAALEKSMHQKLHKGNFLCSWQGDPFDAVAVAKAKNPKKARTNDMFCDAVDSLGLGKF